MQLHLAFQDGFANDEVVAQIDGAEVYRSASLLTDIRIGRADAVDLDVTAPTTLRIELPARNLACELRLTSAACSHVGVSMVGDALRFTVSERPFGYV